jgi:acetyl esterase/lipase/L-ascorbate metabolism protein UlaG (beta-lactamase superfamily)
MVHSLRVPFFRLQWGLLAVILWGLCPVEAAGDAPAEKTAPISDTHVQKDIVYATVDGIDLKLDLYIPQNIEGPLPLVVWIHGGGWLGGSKENPPAKPLLERRFAAASISYRFSNAAPFPAQIHDCKAAVRFLRANAKTYNINPDRIGAWGASAGGHLAALLGTSGSMKALDGTVGKFLETPSVVQAVCDWFGPSDLLTMPIGKRQFTEGQDPELKLLGGPLSEKRDLAELASPITHVTGSAPPFLIMHGDQDNLVPLAQSQLLHDLLKAQGVDSTLLVMEGKGHGFGPEAFEPVAAFFERTLKKNSAVTLFESDTLETTGGDLVIRFIGHGTLMLEWSGKTIHVDPWTQLADYSQLPDADIILITHDHRDHLDMAAIEQIRRPTTTVIVSESCVKQLPDGLVMRNGDQQTLGEHLRVEAVPAYNIEHQRPDGRPYHPQGEGNGYVLDFAGTRIYIAGDTENIPEMANLKDIDAAFLPMNLPYTMTPEMAADAAKLFRPKILYPYHYGDSDTDKLVQLLASEKDIEVRVREMQ